MRAKIAQELRKRFHEALVEALPQFGPDRESVLPRGWRCWRWGAFEDLHFFVVLVVAPQFDEFYLDGAWSPRPLLPGYLSLDELDVAAEECQFRLNSLWNPRGGEGWKLTPGHGLGDPFDPLDPNLGELPAVEESVERVPGAVADAVDKVFAYGLPVFRQVAEARGQSLDDAMPS